jgi:hypothetical protein
MPHAYQQRQVQRAPIRDDSSHWGEYSHDLLAIVVTVLCVAPPILMCFKNQIRQLSKFAE